MANDEIGPPISFEHEIKPLFREGDRRAMLSHFDLWSREDVSKHADRILRSVRSGVMPCDEAWPSEKVSLLERWVESGTPA
jgi:hypothetical protein